MEYTKKFLPFLHLAQKWFLFFMQKRKRFFQSLAFEA